MTIYNVIQIGSQREVLVGTVDATDTEDAQMKAYDQYGDENDRDASYDSFRVEPVTSEPAPLIATSSGKQDASGKYEYLKLYGLPGGDIQVIGDHGTNETAANLFGPVYNGGGQVFTPDGAPVLVKPCILYNHKGWINQSDEREAITLWQTSQTLLEHRALSNERRENREIAANG